MTENQHKIIPIERSGSKIILPQGVPYENVLQAIMRQMKYETEQVTVEAEFPVTPYDGALGLARVLDELYGTLPPSWATEETFFGKKKVNPKSHVVANGPYTTVQVPWGVYQIPQLGVLPDGFVATLETEFNVQQERSFGAVQVTFKVTGTVLRQHEADFNEIVARVRDDLLKNSIYKGKAFKLRLTDNDGSPLYFPEIKFMDTSKVSASDLVLPKVTEDVVTASIFTPLMRTSELRRLDVPLKRGVLLAGTFGTGKTMTAHVTAQLAERNGWTFAYIEYVRDLASAYRFIVPYMPAVVFCEDIDRLMGGERDVDKDRLLNILDGVDGKGYEIMTVLTTNDVNVINPAMLRPGRMDTVVEFGPPDAQAASKLLHKYGRGLIDPEDNLIEASKLLAGQVPAMLAEVVRRSKLRAIRDSEPGSRLVITDSALAGTAREMQMHQRLLTPAPIDLRTDVERAADRLGGFVKEGLVEAAKVEASTWAAIERNDDEQDPSLSVVS